MTKDSNDDKNDKNDKNDGHANDNPYYSVGYKKPPLHSRWKKGQSGGGGGKRKKKRVNLSDFETAFEDALGTLITVNENGTARQMKKLNALATQTVNKALKGNHQATSLVLAMLSRRAAAGNDDGSSDQSAADFRAELEAVFKQMATKSTAKAHESSDKETEKNGEGGGDPPEDE